MKVICWGKGGGSERLRQYFLRKTKKKGNVSKLYDQNLLIYDYLYTFESIELNLVELRKSTILKVNLRLHLIKRTLKRTFLLIKD